MITETKKDTRTYAEKMDEVNAILKYQADRKGCKVTDLEWKRDKFGNIHTRLKNGKETNKSKS